MSAEAKNEVIGDNGMEVLKLGSKLETADSAIVSIGLSAKSEND